MRSFYICLIIFSTILLIPVLCISIYNHPTIDDFWYVAMTRKYGVWGATLEWSRTINGRFTSNLLMSLSAWGFRSLVEYKTLPIVIVVLFFVAAKKLTDVIFSDVFNRLERLTLSAIITSAYFICMPSLYEGIYWMSAVSNYAVAVISFMFILFWHKKITVPITFFQGCFLFLVSFFASALNELMTAMWIALVVAYMMKDRLTDTSINKSKLILLIASLLSLSIQLFSSGNHIKAARYDYTNSWGIGKSSLMAIEQTGFNFLKHSLLSPVWWLVGLVFFTLLLKNKEKLQTRFYYLQPRLILVALLFIAGMFFLPALVDGNIERYLSGMRIINVSYFVSFSGFLFLMVCIVVYFPIEIDKERLKKYQQLLFLLCAIAIVFLPGNFRDISSDLLNGNAALYNQEANARYKTLEGCKSLVCGIPSYTKHPMSLCPVDGGRVNLIRVADVFGKERVFIIKDSLLKP